VTDADRCASDRGSQHPNEDFGPTPGIRAYVAAVVYGFLGFTRSAERRGKVVCMSGPAPKDEPSAERADAWRVAVGRGGRLAARRDPEAAPRSSAASSNARARCGCGWTGMASRRKAVRTAGSGRWRRMHTRRSGRRLVAGITVICGSWKRSLRRWTRFGRAERTVHAGTLDPDRPTPRDVEWGNATRVQATVERREPGLDAL
jgi:hypothetical protein